MSRAERWNARDMSYPNGHRHALPDLYPRTGHRLYTCDRDWTEFCFACRLPVALVEEWRDIGQDLSDKSHAVTRTLAGMASSTTLVLPAYAAAWRTDRPDEMQDEIDRLYQRIRELEQAYPIVGFTTRDIYPKVGPWQGRVADDWWRFVRAMHVAHWQQCTKAQRWFGLNGAKALLESPLHMQGLLL